MADPIDFFYSDGVMTLTNGSAIVTGTFTSWEPGVLPYDIVFANDGQNGASVVLSVESATSMTLAKPWAGPTLTNVPYFILRWIKHTDPRIYGVRVSDYLTRLKAIPENLEEVAAEISEDAAAVAAAMVTLAAIEGNVDADRAAAETARTDAQMAATNALASYNSFRGLYYGPLAADPTTDPLGGALTAGDFYFNTTSGSLRVWTGAAWSTAVLDAAGALIRANNLSDLANPATARTNLGVPTLASNLSDIPNKVTARNNLELKWHHINTTLLAVDSAAIDFTLDPANYRLYRFVYFFSTVTAGGIPSFLLSSNGGTSWYTGATDYNRSYMTHSGATFAASSNVTQGYGPFGGGLTVAAAHIGASGNAELNPGGGSGTVQPIMIANNANYLTGGEQLIMNSIRLAQILAVNRIRFFLSGSNMRAGSWISMEGLRA